MYQRGDKLLSLEKSIYQFYSLENNSFFIFFYISTPVTPPPPNEIPVSFASYIGEFLEDDDNDSVILVVQNNIIYYDNSTNTIKNEILTSENCKESVKNIYYVKKNEEEIIYKNISPFYRCYDLSLQSLIENHFYDCSFVKRGCEYNTPYSP